MNSDLLYYLSNNSGSLSISEIIMNFTAAIAVGFLIFLSYRMSHSGVVYSARFNVSLWMLTVVTTLVMCVIGNNIALSLGMVGALSIVRFRTAIKDPRDTAYIFWAIAVGICCGISDFLIAGIGSAAVFCLMLMIGNVRGNDRYLVIVRGDGKDEGIENKAREILGKRVRLKVRNSTRDTVEMIFEITEKELKLHGGSGKVSSGFYELDSVNRVDIVCQNIETNG